MTGYKKIIENMIEMAVIRFVERKTTHFVTTLSETLVLELDERIGSPVFNIKIEVTQNQIHDLDYQVSGYVSEWGKVYVSSVSFERTLKRNDEANFHTEHEFLTADKLKTFKFDR